MKTEIDMTDMFTAITAKFGVFAKLLQWAVSIGAGLLTAVETSIPFFLPCMILTLMDVVSAVALGRRLHKKHPERFDGKFKSEYKNRILRTMIVVFLAIILGSHVDELLLDGGNVAVRVVMWVFIWYQAWSILENWSSANENKFARVLQHIMVNKAERHLGVDGIGDILNEKTNTKKKENKNGE